MLKVVITAGAENSLEVAYLKSFFELFGIFVCERIYDYDDYDYNNENIDYFYITIMSDSLLNELKKWLKQILEVTMNYMVQFKKMQI